MIKNDDDVFVLERNLRKITHSGIEYDENVSNESTSFNDLPDILEKIQKDDAKGVFHSLCIINDIIKGKQFIHPEILGYLESQELLFSLLKNEIIKDFRGLIDNFMMFGEFYANLSYHSNNFCIYVSQETLFLSLLCSSVTYLKGYPNVLIYVVTILYNIYNVVQNYKIIFSLYDYVEFVNESQDNIAVLCVSKLISALGSSHRLASISKLNIIFNKICDMINKHNELTCSISKEVSNNLMWFIYNIIYCATKDFMSHQNVEEWKLILNSFNTFKLIETLSKMLENKDDQVANEIALYCFSCMVLFNENDIVKLTIRLNFDALNEIIISHIPQLAKYALILIQNYAKTSNMKELMNNKVDNAICIALNEECIEVKEAAAYTICAFMNCAINTIENEWINEATISSLIEIMRNTNDYNLRVLLHDGFSKLFMEFPWLIDCVVDDIQGEIDESSEECDINSNIFDYKIYKAIEDFQTLLGSIKEEENIPGQ